MTSVKYQPHLSAEKVKAPEPLVSVIIPNYNHAPYLPQRIESVLKQNYANFEVIILDDHSTDDSVDVINRYADNAHIRQIAVNEKNSGSPFVQWEKGIALANGKYVWIAESDDIADELFLERTVAEAEKNENVVICQTGSHQITQDGKPYGDKDWDHWRSDAIGKTTVYNGEEFCKKYLRFTNVLYNASGILFRRDAALPFPEHIKQFRACGDWLFWFYVASKGNVAILHEKHNYFRRHKSSTSLKTPIEENLRVLQYFTENGAIQKPGMVHCIWCGIQQRHIKHLKKSDPERYEALMQKFYDASGYHSMFPYHFSQMAKLLSNIVPVGFTFPSNHKL